MKLLTAALRAQLPALYAQENSKDPTVHLKFFTPDSNWTWFATEASPDEDNENDLRFFGHAIGLEEEWGYCMLSELEENRGPMGLPIERDLFSEVIKQTTRCLLARPAYHTSRLEIVTRKNGFSFSAGSSLNS